LQRTSVARGRWLRRNAWTLGVYGLLLVLLAAAKIVHPTYGSFEIQSLVTGALPLGFAAMAQATVVLAGGIDLSVGSMMSLVNVVSALAMAHDADLAAALPVLVLIVVGTAAAGALTGLVVTVSRVPDIIVTLATSFLWAGLALQVMPTPGGAAPMDFVNVFTGELNNVFAWTGDVGANIPAGLLLLLVVLAAVWLPFRRSRSGLALYAVGSNRAAAFLSGVSVARTRIIAYALGGVFAALAGLALTATTSNGSAVSGTYFTLNSVAAIVLGGVSLTGGRGNMIGPLAAAFVLIQVNTLLTFLGFDQNWSQVIQGSLVVLVVMFAGLLLVRRRT
jgi:ribose transport system permease protein